MVILLHYKMKPCATLVPLFLFPRSPLFYLALSAASSVIVRGSPATCSAPLVSQGRVLPHAPLFLVEAPPKSSRHLRPNTTVALPLTADHSVEPPHRNYEPWVRLASLSPLMSLPPAISLPFTGTLNSRATPSVVPTWLPCHATSARPPPSRPCGCLVSAMWHSFLFFPLKNNSDRKSFSDVDVSMAQ